MRGTAAWHWCLHLLLHSSGRLRTSLPAFGTPGVHFAMLTLGRHNATFPVPTPRQTDACLNMRRLGDAVGVELQQPTRQLQRAQPASLGEARPVQRGRGNGGSQRRPAFDGLHRPGTQYSTLRMQLTMRVAFAAWVCSVTPGVTGRASRAFAVPFFICTPVLWGTRPTYLDAI